VSEEYTFINYGDGVTVLKREKIRFDIGTRIAYICEMQHKSCYELAAESKVPLTTIMHIIHGKTQNPGFFTVMRLCEAMGISLSEFAQEEKQQKQGGIGMHEYDEAVLVCFLKHQCRLFPEPVAESEEEAESFLQDCMAVVVNSAKEVEEYFEEVGVDVDDYDDILEADEVFDIGDGRYLIVEG